MTKPTARGDDVNSARNLLDFILPWYEKGSAAHILAARVEAVLALHQPYRMTGHEDLGQFCSHCSAETRAPWPCPTRRALEGEP